MGDERCGHAIDPGRTGTERDQGKHVELTREDGLPGSLEERRTSPQHDGCRQHELDPIGRRLSNEITQSR